MTFCRVIKIIKDMTLSTSSPSGGFAIRRNLGFTGLYPVPNICSSVCRLNPFLIKNAIIEITNKGIVKIYSMPILLSPDINKTKLV
jgi:hypothetical protein